MLFAEAIEKVSSCHNPITPPSSEAGTDHGNDDSSHDVSVSSVCFSATVPATNSNSDDARSVKTIIDTKTATISSNDNTMEKKVSSRQANKRKREQEETILPIKRPKRSLLSEFLTKKEPKKDTIEKEDSSSEKEEFEVEKILDYNKIKVSLYII